MLWFKVDVKPQSPALFGDYGGFSDQLGCNSSIAQTGDDARIENERVQIAIRCDVYETNKSLAIISPKMCEAP